MNLKIEFILLDRLLKSEVISEYEEEIKKEEKRIENKWKRRKETDPLMYQLMKKLSENGQSWTSIEIWILGHLLKELKWLEQQGE